MRRPLHRVQPCVACDLLAHRLLEGALAQLTTTPRRTHILNPARDEGFQPAGLDRAIRMTRALLVAQDADGALDEQVRRATWTRSRRVCFLRHLALARYTDTAKLV